MSFIEGKRAVIEYVRKVDLEALRQSPERWSQELTSDGAICSCAVTVIKTPPGGGSPAGLHTHGVDQVFYILDGTMNVEIDGSAYVVDSGTAVLFPAGVAHRNWNAGTDAIVHLAIAAPAPPKSAAFAISVPS
ncbi:MAG: cupin domain-containing protein [Candidatus Dormibacteraeota bacterium]|uniref:Cupin domain-containing protein n=1 Tax=Candidatus Dormiibacter inghamiae TaxID=3127013 RepID=A0A934KA40_9BACT|nr:cupin domain-containing protein [Candidatus Dormibacteraeota bacterium]MBJ7606514.1 cupin domain-containing protein [Candidatus Dormibacteraeota bacterium]